jgi:class 3 adenylate cyclase
MRGVPWQLRGNGGTFSGLDGPEMVTMVTAKSPRGCLIPIPNNAFWAVGPDNRRIPSWMLREEPMTIGRAKECDVVVRDPSVSRRHVELAWQGGRLFLTDVSATNPTLLNGIPVRKQEPTELTSTDRLQVGGVHFEVLLWNADSDAETRPHPPPRTLAVVLAADVAGYSGLWRRDQAGTMQLFEECHRIFRQQAQRHRGRVLDTGEKGDCVYSLYHSLLMAPSAAMAIRDEIAALNRKTPPDRRIHFRYGMHSGDVVLQGDGIRGDAINTAAHLQARGTPGEILVTGRIQQEAEEQMGFAFEEVRDGEPDGPGELIGYRLLGRAES